MKYRSKDYYLLFEATGVNFFFTDLCTQYYDKFSGVTMSTNNKWRYYVKLEEQKLAETRYKEFYKDIATIEAGASRFKEGIERALASQQKLEASKQVTLEMFDAFVAESSVLMDEYSKYDHMYTDFLFQDSRPEVAQFIELVKTNKNVFREEVNKIFFNEDGYLLTLLKRLGAEKSIPLSNLLYSSMGDVRRLTQDGTSTTNGTNGDDYVLIRDKGEFSHFFKAEAKQFINEFLSDEDNTKLSEIKGISVSKKGIYRGAVRKVTEDYANLQQSIKKFSEVEDGIILVSESTIPEMLSLMARSKAIVTDMGGMLSHAAISSRELGIPCIIGTKIATKLLKNGDMVEVDADRGVVTILL